MKTLKKLFISLLIFIALLIGGLVILIVSPRVQTLLASRFMPEEVSLERVHLGLGGLKVQGLKYTSPEMKIELEQLAAGFSLVEVLSQRQLNIGDLKATGVIIELKTPRETVESDDEHALIGARETSYSDVTDEYVEKLKDLEIPWDDLGKFEGLFRDPTEWPPVTVQHLSAEIRIILPSGKETISLQIDGRDLNPNATPKINLAADYVNSHAEFPLKRLSSTSDLGLNISDRREVVGVNLNSRSSFELYVEQEESYELSLELELAANRNPEATGEIYSIGAVFELEDGGKIDALKIDTAYSYADRSLRGTLSSNLDTESLGDSLLEITRGAKFAIVGNISFEINPAKENARVEGTLSLAAEALDKLAAVPDMNVIADIDMSAVENIVGVEALNLSFSTATNELMFEARALQPFSLDLEKQRPVFRDPEQPMLVLTLHSLPGELINPLLSNTEITFSEATGELMLTGMDDDFHVSTSQPIKIQGLNISEDGELLIDNVDLSVSKSVGYSSGQVKVELDPLELTRGGAQLLHLKLEGLASDLKTDLRFEVEADLSADLAGLLAQPIASPYRNIDRGAVAVKLRSAGTADSLSLNCDLTINNLRSITDKREIESLALKAALELSDAFSSINIKGPLTVKSRGMLTEFSTDLQLNLLEEGIWADLKLKGSALAIEHFETLAAMFENPEYKRADAEGSAILGPVERSSAEPKERAVAAESEPAWAGLGADVDIHLGQINLPDGLILGETELIARIDEDSVTIAKCKTRYEGSAIDAKGILTFETDRAETPYIMSADLSVFEFDVGRFLRQVEPDQEPTLDAVVTINADLRARAAEIERLVDSIAGDISINAQQGVFRALRRGAVSDVIEAAGVLGQLGGMLTGQQDVEAVGQLTTYFNAIRIDNLVIEARRNDDLSTDILNFLLTNPDLKLEGSGSIGNRPDREFYEQPIELILNIGTKPPVRHLFDRLKLLERMEEGQEEPGADEYWELRRPVEISGSITKPNPQEFWKRIIEASARRLIDRQRQEGESSRDATIRELRGILGL